MNKLHFTVNINAARKKVWNTMLEDKTYRQWTSVFNPAGSYYEGSWDKGSKMLFLGLGENSGLSGMVSKIVENKPYEFISIEHVGEVVNGVEDTMSERVKQWAGSHENYSFSEENGVTIITIDLDSKHENKEMFDMLGGMWPDALKKLKEIAEQ